MTDDSTGASNSRTLGPLTAVGLNCSLKPSGDSSTETLVSEVLDELRGHGVTSGAVLRVAASGVLFTIPAHGMTYWVGEAMHKVDYQDLEHRPAKTREATKMAARNAAHLARVVRRDGYPKATT